MYFKTKVTKQSTPNFPKNEHFSLRFVLLPYFWRIVVVTIYYTFRDLKTQVRWVMIVASSFIYFRCYSAVSTIQRIGADSTGVLITINDYRNVSSFVCIMARLIAAITSARNITSRIIKTCARRLTSLYLYAWLTRMW